LRYARQVVTSARPLFIGNTAESKSSSEHPAAPDGVAYAVVPIILSDGQVIGTICVIDTAPHAWTHSESGSLLDIASLLTTELVLRSDISLKRQTQEHLLYSTLHDALTGLPNRSLFIERLRHAMRRAARHPDDLFAVLFLDLDRFKEVNDNLGHFAGDELLRAVARRLEACIRPEDTVARLSGDEFAVLLESITDISDAGRVAERIEEALSFAINLAGAEVTTSASMGIVTSSMAHDQPEQLLRSADMAMYHAKAAGRARYEMFDRAMHTDALERLRLETDLRRAVELGEFTLYYQPTVSLRTGRITGLEALRKIKEWQQAHPRKEPLTIGVNLSVKQFSQPDLIDQITAALAETGAAASSLRLEITESAIIDKGRSAAAILGRIRETGAQVYLDDFGTGYSSVSYLHGLPIDAIKIDRAFVSSMDTDDKNLRLVRTILTLAEIVGVRAEAEGISTSEQLRELRALNCEQGQGYLFSAPITPDAVSELLAANPVW
jgi:diguanylate cyclase (GGDEF)-like protein